MRFQPKSATQFADDGNNGRSLPLPLSSNRASAIVLKAASLAAAPGAMSQVDGTGLL